MRSVDTTNIINSEEYHQIPQVAEEGEDSQYELNDEKGGESPKAA